MARIRLPIKSTAEDISVLRIELCRLRVSEKSLHLEAERVVMPSTALMQLIEVAAADFAAQAVSFGLIEPSDVLCSTQKKVRTVKLSSPRTAGVAATHGSRDGLDACVERCSGGASCHSARRGRPRRQADAASN